jgi:hypothetical protein
VLPRPELAFGKWPWVLHGVLRAFFHIFRWWDALNLLPITLNPTVPTLKEVCLFTWKSAILRAKLSSRSSSKGASYESDSVHRTWLSGRAASPDVLKPTPKENEILVRVYATPVNYGDLTARYFANLTPSEFKVKDANRGTGNQ